MNHNRYSELSQFRPVLFFCFVSFQPGPFTGEVTHRVRGDLAVTHLRVARVEWRQCTTRASSYRQETRCKFRKGRVGHGLGTWGRPGGVGRKGQKVWHCTTQPRVDVAESLGGGPCSACIAAARHRGIHTIFASNSNHQHPNPLHFTSTR